MNLSDPFPAAAVRWKPQAVSGSRALAVAYINARDVMERLDEVVGTAGWKDEYTFLDEGNVLCSLSIRFDGEWITKQDVGGPSEQPDKGDKVKAALSDALKRAAVKFGIGRYLYGLPKQWVDYDSQKKQFVRTPSLPAWALPKTNGTPQSAPQTSAPPKPIDRDRLNYLEGWKEAIQSITTPQKATEAIIEIQEDERLNKPEAKEIRSQVARALISHAHTHGWKLEGNVFVQEEIAV